MLRSLQVPYAPNLLPNEEFLAGYTQEPDGTELFIDEQPDGTGTTVVMVDRVGRLVTVAVSSGGPDGAELLDPEQAETLAREILAASAGG